MTNFLAPIPVTDRQEQRQRKYISPSSLTLFYERPEEHYMKYISPNKPDDFPQTEPMAIGSAFDAYVKNYLHEGLFGKGKDPKFDLDALFEAQVEPQHRDWARTHGMHCFECYSSAGCLADLMTELKQAKGEPRFEFDLFGVVDGSREPVQKTLGSDNPGIIDVDFEVVGGAKLALEGSIVAPESMIVPANPGVPFLGKPDVHFHNAHGASVILDFKVNGYCSKSPPSPKQGYMRMRSVGKFNHGMHKTCHPMTLNGMSINIGNTLDVIDKSWAAQLSIYAWLLGEPVGGEFIVGIDQLVCNAIKDRGNKPQIRIAEHRSLVARQFQIELFHKAAHCWDVISSDWQFRDMTREDSQQRCYALDGVAASLLDKSGGDDDWFNASCRN